MEEVDCEMAAAFQISATSANTDKMAPNKCVNVLIGSRIKFPKQILPFTSCGFRNYL